MDRTVLRDLLLSLLALFDTTSRALGGGLELCWRTSRESHPSEDLSELPPLLVSVAGQEYHCVLTGIAVRQLAKAVLGWMGTAGHLVWPSLIAKMEFAAIHFRYRWSWRILRITFRFLGGPPGNVFQSPDILFSRSSEGKFIPSLPHCTESRKNESQFRKFFKIFLNLRL